MESNSSGREDLDSFFEYLPSELLEIIISYLTDYEELATLYDNYPIFKNLFTNEHFWKRLFISKISGLVDYIPVNFDGNPRYYLIPSYVRAIRTLDRLNGLMKSLVDKINIYIKSEFPDMEYGKIDKSKVTQSFLNKVCYKIFLNTKVDNQQLFDVLMIASEFDKSGNVKQNVDTILKQYADTEGFLAVHLKFLIDRFRIGFYLNSRDLLEFDIDNFTAFMLLYNWAFMSGEDLAGRFVHYDL